MNNGRLAGPCLAGTTVDVVLVKEAFWADFVATLGEGLIGFLTGQGDSGAVVAADLILGSMPGLGIYADGRDLVLSLAGMASGDDSASALVASFALFGLATELPIFKGSADVVVNYAKVLIKRAGDAPLARVLSGQVVGSIAQSISEFSLDPIMRELALLRKLSDSNTAFFDTAKDLVDSDELYSALRRGVARYGDGTDQMLATLTAEVPKRKQRQAALRALGSPRMQQATAEALSNSGKLDVAARAAAQAQWAPKTLDGYVQAMKNAGSGDVVAGAVDPRIARFDRLAGVPGSGNMIGNPDFLTKGPQFEVDVANKLLDEGQELVQIGRGTGGLEIDLITKDYLVESKNINTVGFGAKDEIEKKIAKYTAFKKENADMANKEILFFFDEARPPTEAMIRLMESVKPPIGPIRHRPLAPTTTDRQAKATPKRADTAVRY